MKITIDVTSNEAETILFALAMRSKQKGIHYTQEQEAVSIGERLNNTFESAFGWTPWDRMKANRRPFKSVNIRCYDLPPVE